MIRNVFTTLIVFVALAVPIANAGFLDDFSGDLSAYTSTVLLDAGGVGSNVSAWNNTDGTLKIDTTTFDGIEQSAFIYDGLQLDIGQELIVDAKLTATESSQNAIGLYVGGVAPATGVRENYVTTVLKATGEIFSRGFNGTVEYASTTGGFHAPEDSLSLFIARIDINTYEAGYYKSGLRNIITTRTPSTPNNGSFVGIYGDVRGTGIAVGTLDNLRIVPEPTSAVLVALGLVGLTALRRKKK